MPLVMIEGASGTKAIKKSIDMGKKRSRSMLGVVVLMVIVTFAVGFAENAIVEIVALANAIAGGAVNLLLSLMAGAFITGMSNSLPIIFYRDFLGKKPKK